MPQELNLLIGGEAGQGLQTIGDLLSRSLVRQGYFIAVTQDYHSRIRGGHNAYAIRTGVEEILAGRESIDVLVALNQETIDLHGKELSESALVIADRELNLPVPGVQVPFRELSEPRFSNVAALGALGVLLGLDLSTLAGAINDQFGKKPEAAQKNKEVLDKAVSWARGLPENSRRPLPAARPAKRLMMNGNQAIALGAVAAGLKFYAFYPMTPSTSIANALIAVADKMGLVVEQAEDEIAAINMALGASFAGAPAMVGTSGGGFALMVEGVSLAAMTETPIVVALAMRPGPATGLPTRTEQGDLEFALHAGHGEFPRVLFAPGSIEQCFHLTRKAFELAHHYQGPVLILTDQFLADSFRAVEPFDPGQPIRACDEAGAGDESYQRYRLTESGVSPRLAPGRTTSLVIADSDEHDERGHITEDLVLRRQMVEKRLKKMEGIRKQIVPPELIGDEDCELLLVGWGSSRGAMIEAARTMTENGTRTASLHFSQVWPLTPEQFMPVIERAGRTVCVESNAAGQFARLIRRETGFEFKRKLLRYDGLPVTPEFILRGLTGR